MNVTYLILDGIRDKFEEPNLGISDEFLKKD